MRWLQTLPRAAACAGALAFLSAGACGAQEWPSEAGEDRGAVLAGRQLGPAGAAAWRPSLPPRSSSSSIIENRAGSSGALGSAQVARSEPDGYTFVNAGSGPHLTGPAINPNIGYDTLKDFTHVAMEAADSFVLVAGTALGVKSIADLIKIAPHDAADLGLAGPWLARPSHPRTASSAAPASTSSTCRRPIPA